MTFLLDVNVLIALIDPAHVGHDAAHRWFEDEGRAGWATCPITENGVIRIVAHAKYPNCPGSPAIVSDVVRRLCELDGHQFWPDNLSLTASPRIDPDQIMTSGQVTDSYLLALAAERGGRLASFDRRLSHKAVKGGRAALHLIPGS